MQAVERFLTTLRKTERLLIGLMSGMSMDGVDLALVRIGGVYPHLTIDLMDTDYQPYPREMRAQLQNARAGSAAQVCALNVEVAECFADVVERFLSQRDLSPEQIDAIGSHGQTLVHIPPSDHTGSTLQLGSPSVIAHRTGITTVGNFRQRDMAAGGQGAPLVPVADYLLFAAEPKPLALHNLGSISNLTVLGNDRESVYAFDTGPANQWIDVLAAQIPDNASGLDRNGTYSAQGTVNRPLLDAWMAHPFFQTPPPKSAGYEQWGSWPLQEKVEACSLVDALRTAVEVCAISIADAYRRFVLPRTPTLKRVLVSGGGVHNTTLMASISHHLNSLGLDLAVHPDKRLTDFKEAVAFAILANETLSGRPGTIAGVTGANTPVLCGEIALGTGSR